MATPKFQIDSELLELLIAFEESSSLLEMAKSLGRDHTIVSRKLQRVAQLAPVLRKHGGRWQLTELGRAINARTREFILSVDEDLRHEAEVQRSRSLLPAALVVVNPQAIYHSAVFESRTNPDAEANIAKLVEDWRGKGRPVVFVRHVSEKRESPFFRDAPSSQFLPQFVPLKMDIIIEKSSAGAFEGTSLASLLKEQGLHNIVLAGFTAVECIDATARQARALGLTPWVVCDATASFTLAGAQGTFPKPEAVENIVFANLKVGFAELVNSDEILAL